MAIKKITNSETSTTYRVSVEARGKNRKLRFFRVRHGFKSFEEAKIAEKKLLKECKDECREKELQGLTLEELVGEWYTETLFQKANNPEIRLSPETLLDYLATLKKWTGHLFNKPCSTIREDCFEEIFLNLERLQLSRQHRRRLRRLINEVFDFGIRRGLIPRLFRSPVENISIGRGRNKRNEALTLSEIQKLIHTALAENHKWGKTWAFAYLSLMRSQEMYALPWKNVIFEEKRILVNQSFNIKRERLALLESKSKGTPPSIDAGIKTTKNDDWHYVPINADLERLLVGLKAETGHTKFVFPRDTQWATNKLARSLRMYCQKLDIPSICFHSLRACGATHLLQLGLEPAKVMKLGGWKSMKSMEHYIRQSGIDIKDLNVNLKILPSEVPDNIFLFKKKVSQDIIT